MAGVHTEVNLEAEIVRDLVANRGWVEGEGAKYDKDLALYPEDAIGWVADSQPDLYAKAKTLANGTADRLLLDRLRKSIAQFGTLHVLRKGFKYAGLKGDLRMCVFRPDSTRNADELTLHGKVRLRVVRQVRYSKHNGNSIDLVFFINGIPVATTELKTEFTQSVQDAMEQYRSERRPADPVSKLAEPLLTFQRGAVVHFAASDDEVYMTTHLDGVNTTFLPFNMGNDGAAGNPINPTGGAKTAYLWERILEREAWLDIMDRFVHVERTSAKRDDGRSEMRETLIFPRFQQWDAVARLTEAARVSGPGSNYLIEHSAGSGKSNSIMWLAHRLASLHDESDRKVFDLVAVLTDRNVLDQQLQATISGYAHAEGLVRSIDRKSAGSKSSKLAAALADSVGIVIVTLQTFPFVADQLENAKELQGKTYAIIADEAHSSQTGEDAKELRELLGLSNGEPDTIVDAEDVLTASMAKRASPKNISYFAFTATPKPKTIDLFGTTGADGMKRPFHTYTMQQAIQEGFILDVLQNYTTYKFAYKLATTDARLADKEVPKSETARIISKYAKLHDANVTQRVVIIVEHFRENVQALLGGQAKAMVVCDSRKAAVKYKLAIDEYIRQRGYSNLKTLAAFSGEVVDENEWPGLSFTESNMNHISSAAIPEEFGGPEYQVLIVAEKFQTGFDQPLLTAMYVNKKLANIAAVQTLSRLNRTYIRGAAEKTVTYVLDFVNESQDILAAFTPYYRDAYLTETADPNQVLDIQTKLDSAGVYHQSDVDAYIKAYLTARADKNSAIHTKLKGALDPVIKRYTDWIAAARASADDEDLERAEIFRKNVTTFTRAYNFLSQMYNFGDTEVEKRALFYSALGRLIHQDSDEPAIDASSVIATHVSNRKTFEGSLSLAGHSADGLKPMSAIGTAKARQIQYGPLAEIVEFLNDLFGAQIGDDDAIALLRPYDEVMKGSETLRAQAVNNDREQFMNAGDFIETSNGALLEAGDTVSVENDRQTEAVKKMVGRFFADKETLDRFNRTYGEYLYKHFRATE